MKKAKVLVVEEYSHPKVLENILHLLRQKADVTFYLNKDKQNANDLLFPSSHSSKIIINRWHSSTIFIWLLFFGRRYDYINISTGPEGSHFSDIINILGFYLCCCFFRCFDFQ